MIIYSTEHFMGFSQMLTLRLTKHSNEQAVLIFVSNYDSLRVKQPFFDKLKQTGLFDKIITLIELPLKGLTESQIIQKILADYTPVLEQHDINLHNATAIYEFWDWYASFAFLLNYHNIPYIQLEPLPNNISYFYERPSQFAKKGFISKDYENLYKKIYKVDKHNKPTGNIMLFEETTFFDNANLTEQQKTFVEKFDFYKQFNLVDETDKQKIISCFDVDISFLQNNPITFLLPNSAGLTSLISQKSGDSLKDILYTEENYAQCYITLVDYFANQSNKIVYNPHPDQAKGLKGINTFTNRKIKHFDTNMPAEFLQWIPNFRIKQALSVKSSSTEKLHSIIDENISLDWGVVQAYNIMDRLFVMQKIVSNLDNHTNIKFYGIADKACETLYKCNFENYLTKNFIMLKSCKNLELLNSDVCFVNSKINAAEPISNQNFILDMLEKSQPNSIVFFTNIFNESAFVPLLLSRKFLLDFIVPIQINRTPLDDGEQVGELGTTAIFAFCKNAETRQYLREIQFSKQLKYLNVLLDVSPISEEIAQSWMQQAYNHAITAAVVHNSNNKIIKQKNDEIRQKDGEIRQINEIIHHKDGEIHNVHETIHHKNEEIDHLKNRIIALETSTSWKITKPLRNIKKAFWALTE